MAMRWHDLLFMHWPVSPAVLRPHIPRGLELETFDGVAWLGVVPFRMTGVRPRHLPGLPWASAFPELNVRTYVTAGGKPGVWFFSLDAANPLAVRGARWAFHLPYYDARMDVRWVDGEERYASRRTHRGAPPAEFVARYRPVGAVVAARKGSLDQWLTERYCLYGADRRGRLWRGEIHHARWPLQPAEAQIERNTMAAPLGLTLAPTPALLHFAKFLEVVAWRLTAVHGVHQGSTAGRER
jgi:uncharacterized protein YqjF (DUF2071 family)